MKKRIIGVIATVLIVAVAGIFYACQKEEISQNEESLIKQQKSTNFLLEILNYCSFDFENYVEEESVEFEENVTDAAGVDYTIFITNEESRLAEWVAEQEAAGKTVRTSVMENGLLVGISCDSENFVISVEFPEDFSFEIFNYCSFNFDDYVVGEDIDFEEEVNIEEEDTGNMVCYGFKITTDKEEIDKWVKEEVAKGKDVLVQVIQIAFFVRIYIANSWDPK